MAEYELAHTVRQFVTKTSASGSELNAASAGYRKNCIADCKLVR